MGKKNGESESSGFDIAVVKDKVDEFVGKVIPQPWHATSLAIAAVAVLFFFILTIWGFARSPEKAAAEAERSAVKALVDAEERLARANEALGKAVSGRKGAEREKDKATNQLEREKTKLGTAEEKKKELSGRITGLEKQFKAEKSGKDQANREKKKAESARDSAQKKVAALGGQVKKLEGDLAALQKAHKKLKVTTRDAEAAYKKIMAAVAGLDTPEAKVEALERMQDASRAELAGTEFMGRLDAEIARERKAAGKQEAAAAKEAKIAAKETYEEALRGLKMAAEEDKIGILREAKAKVAGTAYEVSLHKRIVSLEADQKADTAEAIYAEVLDKVKAAPGAFEENLEALEVALEQVKGTSYERKLESMIGKKRKSLKDDIAKAALAEVTAAVKNAPEDYDENIATAEAALPRTEGTKYEKTLKKKLKGLKAARLAKIGKEAYEAARALLKESPKDYAGNVAALRDFKARAEGSAYEAKIAKLLAGQEKKLARQK